MTLSINEADPCAAVASLRQVYYALIAGQGAMTVSFRGGVSGVERSVTYHRAYPDRLLSVIRGLAANFITCSSVSDQKTLLP